MAYGLNEPVCIWAGAILPADEPNVYVVEPVGPVAIKHADREHHSCNSINKVFICP